MSLYLWNGTIQWHTNSDDKDSDTVVHVRINQVFPGGAIGPDITTIDGALGYFPDNSYSGPWALSESPIPLTPGATYQLTVSIDPVGHDTWRFDCFLVLGLSDGTGRSYTFPGHALSQNVRSNSYPFVL